MPRVSSLRNSVEGFDEEIKMKKIIAITILATGAFAVAQNGGNFIEGANGRGLLRAEDNRAAEFEFNVAKLGRPNGESILEGNLQFTQQQNDNGRRVQIQMRKPRALAVNGRVSEFGGPAVMTLPPLQAGGQPRKIEGRCTVRVEDKRLPDGPETPKDNFRIRFMAGEGANAIDFGFAGVVNRGDIRVRDQQP